MVRVVNVRGLRTPGERAGVVYVGRAFAGWPGHPLANPFRLTPAGGRTATEGETGAALAAARRACLGRYRDWLRARPALAADLAILWEQTDGGRLPLGCWCHPLPCHADVLAAGIEVALPPGGVGPVRAAVVGQAGEVVLVGGRGHGMTSGAGGAGITSSHD